MNPFRSKLSTKTADSQKTNRTSNGMNLRDWLTQAEKKLKSAGIGSARLDVLILLEDELAKDRSWLLAHPENAMRPEELKSLNKEIHRRIKHEPIAYIRGFSEFYGRRFVVNKDVLEPRPESETMIELLKNLLCHDSAIYRDTPCIVDVGTGSGALAITAKLEITDSKVLAVDIDPKCLVVARQNAKAHGVKIKFFQGDLLSPLLSTDYRLPTAILLANLPYVPRNFRINQAAAVEPRLAIFGGSDGLDVYRRLFDQLSKGTTLRGERTEYILTESLPPQHEKLAAIAKIVGYKLKKSSDFIQLFAPDGS